MMMRLVSYKNEIILAILAVCVSGGLFLYVWNTVGIAGLTWGGNDFVEYNILAENFLAGNGFSLRNSEPYEPSAARTPGYPLFLALSHILSGGTILASILQILLFAGVAVLSYKILLLLGLGRKLAFGGTLLAIIEPDVVSMALYLISDILFTFLLLFSLYLFLRFLKEDNTQWFFGASLLLGLSAIVRPIGLVFFVILLIGFLWKRGWQWKEVFISWLLVIAFLVPWSARNYNQFGTWRLSSADTFNLYAVVISDVLSFRDGLSYDKARESLMKRFINASDLSPLPSVKNVGYLKYPYQYTEFLLFDNFQYDDWMKKEIKEIFWSSPVSYVKVVFFGTIEYFTQVNWLTPLEHWNLIHPDYRPTKSFQQIFLYEGIGASLGELSQRFSCGVSCILFFGFSGAGRIFWSFLMLFAFIGAWAAFRISGREIRLLLVSVLLFSILLAAAHILFIGTQVQPRYRVPSVPIFSGFALFGVWIVWSKFRSLLRSKSGG